MKTIFGVDDIHDTRIALAERRSRMSAEEAKQDFNESVARGWSAIKQADTSPEAIAALEAKCLAAHEEQLKNVE